MHPSIADIVYKSKGNEKRYFVILKQLIQYFVILFYELRCILTLLIILYLLKLSHKSFKLENVSLKMSNFDSLVVLDIFMLCMLLPSNKQLLLSRLLFRSYRMDDTLVDTGRRQHLHLQTI